MEKLNPNPPLFLTLLTILLIYLQPISSIELLYNGFSQFSLSLYGIADIDTSTKTLVLTNRTNYAIGRALYPSKIPTKDLNTSETLRFSTSFIFSMAPFKNTLPGHGIVFLFVPYTGIHSAAAAQNLGFLNRTNTGNSSNHVFGVEFDVFKNEEFGDINANHVGIDLNSLTSSASRDAGYYTDDGEFKELKLNNGKNYQVWIDYDGFVVNVSMVIAGMKRPKMPLLSVPINLSMVFEDEMYVGFTGSTGQLVEEHRILGWSFSNSNFTLSDGLITTGLPSFELPKDPIFRSKGFIAGISVGIVFFVVAFVVVSLILVRRKRRKDREREEMEDWEFEYWPHRITYQEIEEATNGFCDENVIGIGGNGKVYKGVMQGGVEVAVKRISHATGEGMREFLAEISSIGRLKHRNLVGLRGWCKKEKGTFILVYDYMENESLDKRIYDCDVEKMLSYEDRIRILKDVALGILYLHEGWESKVLHRDIKASNVLLDKEMNAKLGDFGLARMHDHEQVAATTKVVGTVGYMAPEVVRTGRASDKTDVFGFGVLILEVMCGRRPIEENKPPLVEWVWELMSKEQLGQALDERLRANANLLNEEEVEKVLHLGLLCSYPDAGSRPTMRQVAKILEGRVDGSEEETENMEVNLLDSTKAREMWSKYNTSFHHSLHPTFEQMRNSISSSMSLTWSDTIVVGRETGGEDFGKESREGNEEETEDLSEVNLVDSAKSKEIEGDVV